MIELWRRPWTRFGTSQDYALLRDGTGHDTSGPIWVCTPPSGLPIVDGRPGQGKELFQLEDQRRVFALPIPLRPSRGLVVAVPGGTARLSFPGIPDRPVEVLDRVDEAQQEAISLLDRVKAVWARVREVEAATADPATIWDRLHDLWMNHAGGADPEMDVIVRQARQLPAILELLGRAPRRVLRRTQQMIPLSRVQEFDRRAMTWLARQPGETMAERAGGRQRIRAVAREENLDTLENRVLLSYASLAVAVSRDYAGRHRAAAASRRVQLVRAFEKQCRQLALDLAHRGVGPARADATPNFVLQTNPNYRSVWDAWCDLLGRQRVLDELWRWQARSWEEFCALAVVVALRSINGARAVATSPLAFRQEQDQGRWIEHVNPLAVFYLPDQNTTVEVQYDGRTGRLRGFGATIWLRFGSVGENEILTRSAIWPLWHPAGGLDLSDFDSILASLGHVRQERIRGGLTIRPAAAEGAQVMRRGDAACVTLAPSGDALRDGLHALRTVLADLLGQRPR